MEPQSLATAGGGWGADRAWKAELPLQPTPSCSKSPSGMVEELGKLGRRLRSAPQGQWKQGPVGLKTHPIHTHTGVTYLRCSQRPLWPRFPSQSQALSPAHAGSIVAMCPEPQSRPSRRGGTLDLQEQDRPKVTRQQEAREPSTPTSPLDLLGAARLPPHDSAPSPSSGGLLLPARSCSLPFLSQQGLPATPAQHAESRGPRGPGPGPKREGRLGPLRGRAAHVCAGSPGAHLPLHAVLYHAREYPSPGRPARPPQLPSRSGGARLMLPRLLLLGAPCCTGAKPVEAPGDCASGPPISKSWALVLPPQLGGPWPSSPTSPTPARLTS